MPKPLPNRVPVFGRLTGLKQGPGFWQKYPRSRANLPELQLKFLIKNNKYSRETLRKIWQYPASSTKNAKNSYI
jgi:hypothetical protein